MRFIYRLPARANPVTDAPQGFGNGLNVMKTGMAVPQLHGRISKYSGVESISQTLTEDDMLTI